MADYRTANVIPREDIVLSASIAEFKREVLRRYGNVKGSLAALKNQDGLYAQEHRRMAAMYEAVLQVIDEA